MSDLRPSPVHRTALLLLLLPTLVFAGCGDSHDRSTTTHATSPQSQRPQVAGRPAEPSPGTVTVMAAGDIACPPFDVEFQHGRGVADACQQRATSKLILDSNPDAVLMLGDAQYDDGRPSEYRAGYAPTWGRFLEKTHAVAGNHEYAIDDAAKNYFDYFGAAAGPRGKGYYSFDLGAWHVVALNSNCDHVGGCERGSPQQRWLASDLRGHPTRCTLVFMHHPRYSSSIHGSNTFVRDLWQTMERFGVDIVLTGHDHVYERFGKQDADGHASAHGIREWVVGTGGKEHYDITHLQPHSDAHNDHVFGLLELHLAPTSYTWQFDPIAGQHYADPGHDDCS